MHKEQMFLYDQYCFATRLLHLSSESITWWLIIPTCMCRRSTTFCNLKHTCHNVMAKLLFSKVNEESMHKINECYNLPGPSIASRADLPVKSVVRFVIIPTAVPWSFFIWGRAVRVALTTSTTVTLSFMCWEGQRTMCDEKQVQILKVLVSQ